MSRTLEDEGSAVRWLPNATNPHDVVETFLCSSMTLPSIILAQCLPLLFLHAVAPRHWSIKVKAWLSTLVEMTAWAAPIIAIFASPNFESSWVISGVCYALSFGSIYFVRSVDVDVFRQIVWQRAWRLNVPMVSVTYIRICSLLFTTLGIFCIDFTNFGERFMKSETFGLTLMDIGLGCALFSSGLSEGLRRRPVSVPNRLFWQCLPPLIVGLFRFGILSSIGYRVDVTEYGVHWNAFFTFAAMPVLYSTLQCAAMCVGHFEHVCLIAFAFIAGGPWQWLLSLSGRYLIDDDLRRNVVEANKEGIASVVGFFGVYLAGRIYGARVLDKNVSHAAALLVPLAMVLVAYAMDAWSPLLNASIGSYQIGYDIPYGGTISSAGRAQAELGWQSWKVLLQPISRRLGNSGYVLYCAGMNAFLIRCLELLNGLFLPRLWERGAVHGERGSPTEKARHAHWLKSATPVGRYTSSVNRSQLVYFVVANIFTGLTNVVLATHEFTDFEAYFVQAAYVAALGTVALLLPQQ